jgi:hypothetical protein
MYVYVTHILGALGAVVKPVMGVSDGIANVAHGISNEISDSKARTYHRPPRALLRSPFDFKSIIISPYDHTKALVQDFVLKDEPTFGNDAFVIATVVLRIKDPRTDTLVEIVAAVTEHSIFQLTIDTNRKVSKNWRLNFSTDISHCVFNARVRSVEMIRQDATINRQRYEIICLNADIACKVYNALYELAHKMSSPERMLAIVPVMSLLSVSGPITTSEEDIPEPQYDLANTGNESPTRARRSESLQTRG